MSPHLDSASTGYTLSDSLFTDKHLDHTHIHPDGISPQKWGAMVALATVSLICGLLPYWTFTRHGTERGKVRQTLVLFLSNASGGILLATLLLHVLPELRHKTSHLTDPTDDGHDTEVTEHTLSLLPEVFTLYGFCLIFFFEVAATSLLPSNHSHHHHHHHHLYEQPGESIVDEKDSKCEKKHFSSGVTLDDKNSVISEESKFTSQQSLWKVVVYLLALSFHAVMEGVAVGLQGESQLWMTFGAIASHKFLISFCVGVELVRVGASLKVTLSSLISFAIVSPIGILIGSSVTSIAETQFLLQIEGVACGTLLYVVFFDILRPSQHVDGLVEHNDDNLSAVFASSKVWKVAEEFVPFVGVAIGVLLAKCLIEVGEHVH